MLILLAFGFFFLKIANFSLVCLSYVLFGFTSYGFSFAQLCARLWHYQLGAKQSSDAAFSCFLCKLERERERAGGGGGGGATTHGQKITPAAVGLVAVLRDVSSGKTTPAQAAKPFSAALKKVAEVSVGV